MVTPSKTQILRRAVVYAAMTLSVLVLSTLLVFAMLGYRYNQQDNNFIQGGLVQFITEPTGASVRVGTVELANQTRSKITLNPGDYPVRMSLDGYRDWSKDVTVKAGEVLWLNSARMIPNELTTEAMLELPRLGSVSMQERGQNIVLLTDPGKPELRVVRSNAEELAPQVVTLPEEVYTTLDGQQFRLERQSGDNRHVLMTQTAGDSLRWIMVDLERPGESYTIGANDAELVNSVQLDPSSNFRGYVQYDDGSIRRLDIGSGELSEVLVGGTGTFSLTSRGALFYVTRPTEDKPTQVQTGYVSAGKDVPRLLQTIDTAESVRIAAGQYFDEFYVVTSVGSLSTVREYGDFPTSDSMDRIRASNTLRIRTPELVELLSFKTSGRIIALQQASTQTVYDLDLKKQTDVALGGGSTTGVRAIEWLDSFHFWDDRNGSAIHYEFDGTNQHTLTNVVPGFSAAYSQNNEYFYSVGKTDQGFSLQRTRMLTE